MLPLNGDNIFKSINDISLGIKYPSPFISILYVLHNSLNCHKYVNRQAKRSIICMERQIFAIVSGDLCLTGTCTLGRQSKLQEGARIPGDWLCISDWQINHQLVFGQREHREGERHVAGSHMFHSSWRNTKHYDHMVNVGESQYLYWHKNTLKTTVHTKTHTPTFTGFTHRLLLLL